MGSKVSAACFRTQDGRCVFSSSAKETVSYFGAIGYPCPQYANPADFLFMHVLTASGDAVDDSRCATLVASWEASSQRAQADATVAGSFSASDGAVLPLPPRNSTASPWTQFQTLLKRAASDVKRNPMRGKAQVGQSVVFALIITLIWFQVSAAHARTRAPTHAPTHPRTHAPTHPRTPTSLRCMHARMHMHMPPSYMRMPLASPAAQVSNDMNSVQDRMGCLFFFAANGMMTNIMGVLTTFSNERAAVLREQENGMYSALPYFCARVLVDIPLKLLSPILFASIAYWSVGLQNDASRFGSAILTNILLGLSSNSFGLFLACIFPDVAIALLVAPLIILPLMMFSGCAHTPAPSSWTVIRPHSAHVALVSSPAPALAPIRRHWHPFVVIGTTPR